MKRISRRKHGGNDAKPTPLIVMGVLLFVSLTARCAGNSGSNESGTTTGGSRATGGASASGGAISASGRGGSTVVLGGSSSAACSATTVASDCPLPASTCDGDGVTLRYYTAPNCVMGRCSFTEQTMRCPSACYSGACASSTTTVMISPPPPDPACVGGAERPAAAGNGGATGGGGDGGMAGAGATNGCPLPASYCADSMTLVYYTDPHCEGDQCTANGNTLVCDAGCVDGGCQGSRTAR